MAANSLSPSNDTRVPRELRTSEVRDWLAGLPVAADAGHCDHCGHEEPPFLIREEGDSPCCTLCVIRMREQDEWERFVLTELFLGALEAMEERCDTIMFRSFGEAARDAGERFLARWGA